MSSVKTNLLKEGQSRLQVDQDSQRLGEGKEGHIFNQLLYIRLEANLLYFVSPTPFRLC